VLLARLRQQRLELVQEARAIVDGAEAEERDLTEEEQRQYDQNMADVDSLDQRIARLEGIAQREAQLAEPQGPAPIHTRSDPAPDDDPSLGMPENDLRNYSLVRAMRAASRNDWRDAGLEQEASRAQAQRLGRDPEGFFVPYDWQARSLQSLADQERRDLTVGTATAGGHTVDTELLASSFIDLLRNRMAVRQAGATVLSNLTGDLAIPRQTGGATAYWVAESGSPTESQQSVDQVTMSPKTVGAFTDFSRKLLLQSSLDVEMFVRNDLSMVVALAVDLAALHGTGASNQPTGLVNVAGIGSVAGGTNGAAPTHDHIVDLETEVSIDNADMGRLAYMSNSRIRGKLKKTFVDSGSNAERVWDSRSGNTPLNGYPAQITNQVASNLTKGSGTNLSAIFFGNWADLLLGFWSGLDILVNPYSDSTSGTVRIVALQDVDVAVRHPESFSAMLDADTA